MAQMHFAVFMSGDSNYHIAGWRLPEAYADTGVTLKRWIEFARTMERGKLDMLFIADSHGVAGADDLETLSHSPQVSRFEPFTVLSALAAVTERIGLVSTCATTYNEPYTVARMFASLDHLSGGRAGWNFVTGANREDALNFSHKEHVPHAQRYDRAEEFADVVRGLWDSFEDDAFLRDKASGRFFDPKKLHVLNHASKHFSVKGPLSIGRPPQGHPVLVQAGKSEPAREVSARVADAVFTSQTNIEDAQKFYADVKGRMAKFGRSPDHIKIMPGVAIFTGRTAEEAEEKYERLHALIHPQAALALLKERLGGIDLSGHPLDGPVPEMKGNDVRMSNPPELARLARRENLTIRQLAYRYAAARSHWMIRGSAVQIADQLEEWFVKKAADGFNLLPQYLPGALDDFVDLVVPELQRRGLFRREYEGRTLREHLGLPRPVNRYAAAARAAE
ncbi:MAG TPA: LLM class flavin-dependent oxidoreductase [Stellaceae bacterium]|nr:LLM class flavin-dependent oxidoreductase [Stellaceae bacterium]